MTQTIIFFISKTNKQTLQNKTARKVLHGEY